MRLLSPLSHPCQRQAANPGLAVEIQWTTRWPCTTCIVWIEPVRIVTEYFFPHNVQSVSDRTTCVTSMSSSPSIKGFAGDHRKALFRDCSSVIALSFFRSLRIPFAAPDFFLIAVNCPFTTKNSILSPGTIPSSVQCSKCSVICRFKLGFDIPQYLYISAKSRNLASLLNSQMLRISILPETRCSAGPGRQLIVETPSTLLTDKSRHLLNHLHMYRIPIGACWIGTDWVIALFCQHFCPMGLQLRKVVK